MSWSTCSILDADGGVHEDADDLPDDDHETHDDRHDAEEADDAEPRPAEVKEDTGDGGKWQFLDDVGRAAVYLSNLASATLTIVKVFFAIMLALNISLNFIYLTHFHSIFMQSSP